MPVKLNHRFTLALLIIIILCTTITGPNLRSVIFSPPPPPSPFHPVPICGRDATVKMRAMSHIMVKAGLT